MTIAVLTYPTGDKMLDDLTEFVAARLPALHKPDIGRKASLAEERFIERMAACRCPLKQGWSFVYRFARDHAVERGCASDGAPDLLAHQLTRLVPTMFAAARRCMVVGEDGRDWSGCGQ